MNMCGDDMGRDKGCTTVLVVKVRLMMLEKRLVGIVEVKTRGRAIDKERSFVCGWRRGERPEYHFLGDEAQ
jgi:hypothetical protein